MPLPYTKPNVTYDHIINLNSNDVRTFNSGTYNNGHVLIIPKTGIDTGKGLVFANLASVTIIGGHFRPAVKAWGTYTGGAEAPATLTFNGCSQVYLEGVITDNINLFVDNPDSGENGGDAIFFSAGNSETPVARRGGSFTAQNCAFINVRGVETLPAGSGTNLRAAHGDFFQVGSTTMGKAGVCRFYNVTASGNYQGFFMDPQPAAPPTATRTYYPGGNSGIIMQRCNFKRTAAAPGNRLIFLISSMGNYNDRGYPATFDDVWCQGWGTETLEGTIWPNHEQGTNGFTTKYRASYGTDATGRFAEWKGLQDPGKQIVGKVYQGAPPDGDFAPINRIGVGYVEGTDLAGPTTPTVPTTPTSYTNLLRAGQTWTTGGPGTVTVDPITNQITISADGTGLVYARRGLATQINKVYQLTWSNDTSTVMFRQIGTSEGLDNIRTANVSVPGDNKIEFTATSTTTWVSFQRTTAATSVVASVPILQEVPQFSNSARRLNAKNQYFSLDAQAQGLRMSNANWYIGGWIAFTYMPNSVSYIMDFGRTDPGNVAGGASRIRMIWDPDQTKLAASTSEFTGINYRENYVISPLQVDTWYYVSITAGTNADVSLRLGATKASSYVGTSLPPVSATEICRLLQLGARVANPRTSFSPLRYSNWIWCSNFIPSDPQIAELASGTPPEQVTGLTAPTGADLHIWPMAGLGTTEPSLGSGAALTSNSTYGSIVTVPGQVTSAPVQVVSPTPLDLIIT